MLFFPDLIDSDTQPCHILENIELARQPIVINEFKDGNKQIIKTHTSSLGENLRMRWNLLNSSKIKEFSNFWDTVEGSSNFWYFNQKFFNFTGQWQFLETPVIEPVVSNSLSGAYNLAITIRKTGF